MSKMKGSSSGEMPNPVSSTLSTASLPSARSATRIRPPGGVYLTALVTMLVSTCSSRTASPSTQTGSVLIVDVSIQPVVAGESGDGPAYRLGHVERLSIQPDLSGHHALDVEQIVDQMRDVADLSRDHLCARGRRTRPRRASTRARGRRC